MKKLFAGIRYRGSTDFVERFWSRVKVMESGCWEWTAGKLKGYGILGGRGTSLRAYSVAWEMVNGKEAPKWDSGLEFDHLCRNRACVNPNHLEIVTSGENTRRGNSQWGINYRKTHYIRGHDLKLARIYKNGGRICRICENEWRQKKRHAFLRAGLTRDGNHRKKRLRSNVKVLPV